MTEKPMILLALEMLAYMQLAAGDPESMDVFENNYASWIRGGRQEMAFINLQLMAQAWGYQMPNLEI